MKKIMTLLLVFAAFNKTAQAQVAEGWTCVMSGEQRAFEVEVGDVLLNNLTVTETPSFIPAGLTELNLELAVVNRATIDAAVSVMVVGVDAEGRVVAALSATAGFGAVRAGRSEILEDYVYVDTGTAAKIVRFCIAAYVAAAD